MSIKKVVAGWLLDLQPGGLHLKRYCKTFTTKSEALAYQAWLKTKVTQSPEWEPPKRDRRRLSELVDVWHQHHGVNLRAGADTYSRLKSLCTTLRNPFIEQFNAAMFAEYRKNRIASGISANTMNCEHAYLRSIFNEARRLGHFKGENPLTPVRQIMVPERELSFLSSEDIKLLLNALNGDALLIAKVCLSTGARWSEAELLKPSQVKNGLIHFSNTKSGKNRSVPISSSLEQELLLQMQKREGMGRLFMYAYTAFRKSVERAGMSLLGHSNLTMTMRYAICRRTIFRKQSC